MLLEWQDIGIHTAEQKAPIAVESPQPDQIVAALRDYDRDAAIGAVVMTGAGERAFSAGQDFAEAHDFDADRAQSWIREWETFYGTLRRLTKPVVAALNGTAAGSAFQTVLLGDVRVGHPGVRMGQPEINSGIASVTGPRIMNLILGMSRTIELTLTGRLMDAQECQHIGVLHHMVPEDQVLPRSLEIARELGAKPPVAMRLDKQRFREMTEASFRETIDAAIRLHAESYATGEPQRMMEAFFEQRKKH